jgi:hypothetical protein
VDTTQCRRMGAMSDCSSPSLSVRAVSERWWMQAQGRRMGAESDGFSSPSLSVRAVSERWWNQLKASDWALSRTSCRRGSVLELCPSAGGCTLKVAKWALSRTASRPRSVSELCPSAGGYSSRPPNGLYVRLLVAVAQCPSCFRALDSAQGRRMGR